MSSKTIDYFYRKLFPLEAPSEKTPWLYYQFFNIFRVLPKVLKNLIQNLTSYVAAEYPDSMLSEPNDKKVKKSFWGGFLFTIFACLIIQGIWCLLEGTLYGNDKSKYYFVEDWPNLLNYSIVAPMYVGLGLKLLTMVSQGLATLKKIPQKYSNNPKSFIFPKGRFGILAIIILSISVIVTVNYVMETLDPAIYSRHFWFITEIASSGERLYGGLGIYYTLMTFTLMAFSIFALCSFLTFFVITISVGKSLEEYDKISNLKISDLRTQLNYFINASITVKKITAFYMMNAFTWKWQSPQSSLNLKFMALALTFFGILVIAVPRYYIETQLYRLQVRDALNKDDVDYSNLLPRRLKIISILIDTTIFSIFIATFFKIF